MKYEFTGDTRLVNGHTLRQIRAVRDFEEVSAGDLGGWIEKPANLSQSDNAWVADEAVAYDNARVTDNATINGNARVHGDAYISGCSIVSGRTEIYDSAFVQDAAVSDSARIYESALVRGHTNINGSAMISGQAYVKNAFITENAIVRGTAFVSDCACIGSGAMLTDAKRDYMAVHGVGKMAESITFYRTSDGNIGAMIGLYTVPRLYEYFLYIASKYQNEDAYEFVTAGYLADRHFNGES